MCLANPILEFPSQAVKRNLRENPVCKPGMGPEGVLCMGYKIPLLKPREVRANLRALGFEHRRTVGSHEQWVREADGTRIRAFVTVDAGKDQFSKGLMKMMIRQSLFSAEEFCSGVMKVANSAPKPVTEGNKNA